MSERIDGAAVPLALGEVRSPPPTVAPDGGYFLSHDRRLLYVVIDLAEAPRTFAAEHAAILAVRRAIASLRPEFPSVEAGVTGAPALFSDELTAATRDGQIASVLALVLTLGLLLLAFRRLVTSCAMLAVLALSLGWSLGVITLLVGHLTIFSMMFVSVVIGLGTDYGIYFLFRYREERVLGRDARRRARAHRRAQRPRHSAGCPHRRGDLLHPDHRRVPRHPRFRLHLRHRDPSRVPVDADRLPGGRAADRPVAEGPATRADRRQPGRPPAARPQASERAARGPGAGVARALSEDHRRRRGPPDRGVAVGRTARGLRLQHVESPGRRHRVGRLGDGRPPPPRDARCSPRSRRRRRSRSSRPGRPRSSACPPSRTSRACCRCCRIGRPRSWPCFSAWRTWRTASARALRAPSISARSPRRSRP